MPTCSACRWLPLIGCTAHQLPTHGFCLCSRPPVLQADLIKLSDADMEWLHGISLATALINPCAVSGRTVNNEEGSENRKQYLPLGRGLSRWES